MASQKYGWAGFQRAINAPGPFVFKPLTDNGYDGVDVPKYFDGKGARWGTMARPAQEFVDNPAPFLGLYDRVSVSIVWTGEAAYPDTSKPASSKDKFKPNPCVSDLSRLSPLQREEIRTKIPAFYEFMAAPAATLGISGIPRPDNPPVVIDTRPGGVNAQYQTTGESTSRARPPPSISGHGHPSRASTYRNLQVVHLRPRNVTVPMISAYYGSFRTTVTWAVGEPPQPYDSKQMVGSLVTFAPQTPIPSIIWDDARVFEDYFLPTLTFTPEVDNSPERNAFACITMHSVHVGCVAVLVFKKRSRADLSTSLTAEERQSLNIGRTCAEVEAYYRGRAHQHRRPN
ncbi:hypothetical protein GY45DRAFT_1431195 [Cubamyces sp. BRFM 1775]|nr:hypothetical protein GY45DRAFT_1431195 [Cubamyces sp. BRFM 1775]